MSRTTRTLCLLLAAVPLVVSSCSDSEPPPAPAPPASSAASSDSTSRAVCELITTTELRRISGVTWKESSAAGDKRGPASCSWSKGERGAVVTVMSGREWYKALVASSGKGTRSSLAREVKALEAEHGPEVDSDRAACTVFAELGALATTTTSPRGTTMITTTDEDGSSASACAEGRVLTVSMPQGTSDGVLGQVIDVLDRP